ncbi:SEC-C metal-binding domain-containing protein [Halomonas sp. MCCC 1A11062]|uniref:SEC-C metal-binding domain-containing protein n=1 Tax=Halomonas sp. MCCC 1A11062 TaxID=2733485 RepID=UPI001F46A236|nr:SEC-C metal-binding domain-containing protein [Halomonas sp. MCCC 1A11062]MCE8040225.1 hypothetical protein [Halomonas sp. MCCC 1A11062]
MLLFLLNGASLLKPTLKNKGGTLRERYLAKLAGASFFELWSYANVYTDEGKAKSGKGEELCDLLVVFGNDVILFSDKDIKFNSNIETSVAWKRWFKRAVVKSCKQLYGAESWIKRYPDRIYLDDKCNAPFPIDLSGDLNFNLVAVTCNTIPHAERYFGGNSSSSFLQVYALDEKMCMERPFHVGWLYPNKKYIHILDESSLDLLLGELDTAYDFINYLNEKSDAIISGQLSLASGEEEVLAHYYRERQVNKTLTGSIGELEHLSLGTLILQEGLWHEYQEETQGKFERFFKENSLFWDSLIESFSKNILAGRVGVGQDLPFNSHERAVRFLASECRVSRCFLARAFLEKLQAVPDNRRSARVMRSPQNDNLLYVFLFLPMDEGQSYEDYREERGGYNHAYALVAKFLHQDITNVVVLSTDTKGVLGRSEDVLAAEFDGPLKGEELKLAKKLHEEDCILKHVFEYKDRSVSGLVGNKPYRNMDKIYGRNDKCPCGSGLKYKKCCGK